MDNKLLEKCIKEVLQVGDTHGMDVMGMAQDFSDFHSLIREDEAVFRGYKVYTAVSKVYNNKLRDLGIIETEDK